MGTLQVNLLRYAGRFAAIYVLIKVVLFAVLFIALQFFQTEIPVKHVAFVAPLVTAMLVGQRLFKREGARLIGGKLHKLTGLCLLIIIAIDAPLGYLAFPDIEGLSDIMGLIIGLVLFFAFLAYWSIFFGYRIGFGTAEKEAAKRDARNAG
ncbi:ABZJ_00895 family protein [Pseudovibrio sp. JE062]|uniref:ABZJ_00895 family protein n=1 Tax=Pseudovibrio sp. JE062 TaxID=439495 RepID=UPI000186C10C|nr:ABZJ_00895 family protein [Pseudovibrio sp. JE062]EEA92177.1 hypothetical protein PJE062_3996 [Pseudovibrio sp. JE062]